MSVASRRVADADRSRVCVFCGVPTVRTDFGRLGEDVASRRPAAHPAIAVRDHATLLEVAERLEFAADLGCHLMGNIDRGEAGQMNVEHRIEFSPYVVLFLDAILQLTRVHVQIIELICGIPVTDQLPA